MKSMKVTLLFAVLFIGLAFTMQAQVKNDDILMTIAGKKITVGEFVAIYQKNNQKNEVLDKKNLSDYLDLYINFKLKVREAEDRRAGGALGDGRLDVDISGGDGAAAMGAIYLHGDSFISSREAPKWLPGQPPES